MKTPTPSKAAENQRKKENLRNKTDIRNIENKYQNGRSKFYIVSNYI